MSYVTYKVLHLLGVFLVFASLGGLILRADAGQSEQKDATHKLAGRTHGFALLIVLVGGFGLLARLGIEHDWLFPGWIWIKLVIWLLLGASLVVIRKRLLPPRVLWLVIPAFGALAAWLAVAKPF